MDIISSLFSSQDMLAHFALIILIALYGLFALIVGIQINNLNRSVTQVGFSVILNFLAFFHLVTALALLLLTVLSL